MLVTNSLIMPISLDLEGELPSFSSSFFFLLNRYYNISMIPVSPLDKIDSVYSISFCSSLVDFLCASSSVLGKEELALDILILNFGYAVGAVKGGYFLLDKGKFNYVRRN